MDELRLKKLRLAQGLSLEALAATMGGLVTKQALSKYERNVSKPSLVVSERLASALNVKTIDLWAQPDFRIEYVAFRKHSRLTKAEVARLSSCCDLEIEKRIRLQRIVWQGDKPELAAGEYKIRALSDAETAAEELRSAWKLGTSPIGNLTNILESRLIHVIEVEADDRFDGLSANVLSGCDRIGVAVISRKGLSGGRQRLSLAHELGHLVCDPIDVDEEKTAFRFAGAFLAPQDELRKETGSKRSSISLPELQILAKKYGLSLQATLRRLRDLGIIKSCYYTDWCKLISRKGWRKNEPEEIEPEISYWVDQSATRAFAEGLISGEEMGELTAKFSECETNNSLQFKKSFMELPLSERHRVLEEQADRLSDYYASTSEDEADGEFYEYE